MKDDWKLAPFDPMDWLCRAASPGTPLKKVGNMTLNELQQTLCWLLAEEHFVRRTSSVATHKEQGITQ